jgi:hypothetical protein
MVSTECLRFQILQRFQSGQVYHNVKQGLSKKKNQNTHHCIFTFIECINISNDK